jgi:predicted O-methyltransferase YrrM
MTNNTNLWAKDGHFNKDQEQYIKNLVATLNPEYAIETGFCSGRSSYTVLEAGKNTIKKMISIDIDLDYVSSGREHKAMLEEHYVDNGFQVIEEDSSIAITIKFMGSEFPNGVDFAMVDGSHSYKGCLGDIVGILPHLNSGGVMVIDDYKSGPPNGCSIEGVNQACDLIASTHPSLLKQEWHCEGKGFCVFTKSVTDR